MEQDHIHKFFIVSAHAARSHPESDNAESTEIALNPHRPTPQLSFRV